MVKETELDRILAIKIARSLHEPNINFRVQPGLQSYYQQQPETSSMNMENEKANLHKHPTFTILRLSFVDILTGKKWRFGIFSFTNDITGNLK